MTKTTEELMHAFDIARSRLDEMNQGEEISWQTYDELTDMLDGLKARTQSEIEAAERKGFKSGYIEGLHYAGDNICQEDLDKITDSFLKNPER